MLDTLPTRWRSFATAAATDPVDREREHIISAWGASRRLLLSRDHDGTEVPGGFETVARPPDEWLDPDPPLPAPQELFTALVLRSEIHG